MSSWSIVFVLALQNGFEWYTKKWTPAIFWLFTLCDGKSPFQTGQSSINKLINGPISCGKLPVGEVRPRIWSEFGKCKSAERSPGVHVFGEQGCKQAENRGLIGLFLTAKIAINVYLRTGPCSIANSENLTFAEVNRPPEGDLRADHHSQLGIIHPSSYANEGAEKLMDLGMILGMVS